MTGPRTREPRTRAHRLAYASIAVAIVGIVLTGVYNLQGNDDSARLIVGQQFNGSVTINSPTNPATAFDLPTTYLNNQCKLRDDQQTTCIEVKSGSSIGPGSGDVSAISSDSLAVRVKYKNMSDTRQDNVTIKIVADSEHIKYIPQTTRIWNSLAPGGGLQSTDSLAAGGVNVGSYATGGAVYLEAVYLVAEQDAFSCGDNLIPVTAVATQGELVNQDVATIRVVRSC